MRAACRFAALAVVLICTVAAAELGVLEGKVLERVVVAHRHGARTSVFNINGTCDALGCGTLTTQGALMLRSLGATFRENYGAILPSFYDVRSIQSVSDDSTRVIQSASAFLEGLFAYNASIPVNPGVSTTDASTIRPWSNPGFHLHQDGLEIAMILNLTSTALSILPVADIVAIATEIGLSTLECDVVPVLCIAQEVDYLASMLAEGRLAEFPIGATYYPQLVQIQTIFFRNLESMFDNDVMRDSFFRDSGYPGALLVNAMLDAAQNEALVLAEFSGHDTSLMPLYAALDNFTFNYPPFATAVVFEVYSGNSGARSSQHNLAEVDVNDGFAAAAARLQPQRKESKSESGASLFIRPLVGVCDQLPGAHAYSWSPLTLTCVGESGTMYRSESGCPLADLQRFIARVTPSSTCYAWPKDLIDASCDPVFSPQAPKHKSACAEYRAACPLVACGPGRAITGNLTCVAV